MDPTSKFKQNYNKYIESRNEQMRTALSSPSKGKTFSPNRFYVLGIVVGLLIVGPAAAYLFLNNSLTQTANNSSNSQTTSQNVKNLPQQITEVQIDQEMQKIWGPYYTDVQDNKKYREIAKQSILEQQAVSRAAKQYNIEISQGEVTAARANLLGNSSKVASLDTVPVNETIKDTLTQEEIAKKIVNSKTVDIASSFKSQDSDFETQKKRAQDSLESIRKLLLSGKSMKEAYQEAKKSPTFDTGLTIREGVYVTKDSGWGKDAIDAIFATPKGGVTLVTGKADSFMVAKVIDENTTQYNSYNQWLSSQTQ